jgi:hypothetical protein
VTSPAEEQERERCPGHDGFSLPSTECAQNCGLAPWCFHCASALPCAAELIPAGLQLPFRSVLLRGCAPLVAAAWIHWQPHKAP